MDFWLAIVAIVAITSIAKVLRSRHLAMARLPAMLRRSTVASRCSIAS